MEELKKDRIGKSEMLNRLVAEDLVDAAWMLDADTLQFEHITESTLQLSGHSIEETLGRPFTERLAPESFATCGRFFKNGRKEYNEGKRTAYTLEVELLHKHKASYWVEIKAIFFRNPEGKLKIIGVSRDITERKRIEQNLKDQNITLAEALAEKEHLLKEIKVLQSLLPICSGCKRIRDENGKWWPLDAYIQSHSDSVFTHTMCGDCKSVFYPDLQ